MARCCGGSSCACSVQAGPHIIIAGTGSPGDPFVVTGDVDLEVLDTPSINLTLTGPGEEDDPWVVSGAFASTSKLDHLGDVTSPTPTNGQVLAWNSSTSDWRPAGPTTAAAGTVSTDTSLSGDGSSGLPLQVREDPARFLATTAAGLGLSNTGVNATVRRFTDSTARAAASPGPTLNTVSILDSNPGQFDYWTGSAWSPAGLFILSVTGAALYELSGAYTGAQRITLMVVNVDTITDDSGAFDAIPALSLAGKAGVLTATVTPTTDALGTGVPWTSVVVGDSGAIRGTAYRIDTGAAMPSAPITATVTAMTY